MHDTLEGMLTTVRGLENLKQTHKASLIISKTGNLFLDFTGSAPDKDKLLEITEKLSELDTDYNKGAERYQKLLKVDEMGSKNRQSSTFFNSYKQITDRHNKVFEKE